MFLLGAIHSGNGQTQLNQISEAAGLHKINNKVYKLHERIVGPIIELVAKETCAEAAEEERQLTLDNLEELKKLM